MRIPAPRFWHSNSALIAVLPTGLGAVLSMVALAPPALDPYRFWAFLTLAVAITLVVWANAATQEQQKESSARTVEELLAKLTAAPATPLRASVHKLSSLTAPEIRAEVQKIASLMRQMEHSFHLSRDRVLFAPQTNENWKERTDQMLAFSQERANRWRSDLRPEAMALWDEMRRRIYGAPPYPLNMDGDIALDHASLAGPAPLTAAATAMEQLARELPG